MKKNCIEHNIYDKLPKELKSLTKDFEGREKDIVLLSSIGVLSNCFPNVHGIYGGKIIYPHLYVVIIAPPASGKGSMEKSKILIDKIHDKLLKESRQEYDECMSNNTISNKNSCPQIEIKVLPANTSDADMCDYLNSSKNGLVIVESEADTMGHNLKKEWGNYSDILRKAFHHEQVSISRKTNKEFKEVKQPKLAMIISGTPEQLKPIIQSRENGLFSRIIFYNFDEISEFKNVFAKSMKSRDDAFEEMGNKIFDLYFQLDNLEHSIEFTFTEKQQRRFLKIFEPIHKDTAQNSEGFISNVYRHALVSFRIAMILTIVREMETITDKKVLICSNKDFKTAMELTEMLLKHSKFIYDSFGEHGWLSTQDENIIDDLPIQFERKEIVEIGKKYGVSTRTIDYKLKNWLKRKFIRKERKGVYKKL